MNFVGSELSWPLAMLPEMEAMKNVWVRMLLLSEVGQVGSKGVDSPGGRGLELGW